MDFLVVFSVESDNEARSHGQSHQFAKFAVALSFALFSPNRFRDTDQFGCREYRIEFVARKYYTKYSRN